MKTIFVDLQFAPAAVTRTCRTRYIERPQSLEMALSHCTPQFFLRNLARVQRESEDVLPFDRFYLHVERGVGAPGHQSPLTTVRRPELLEQMNAPSMDEIRRMFAELTKKISWADGLQIRSRRSRM